MYNLRTPHTQRELLDMGIKCSDSQLLLLGSRGLINKTEGKWGNAQFLFSIKNRPHL